jgi:hypothetical protein
VLSGGLVGIVLRSVEHTADTCCENFPSLFSLQKSCVYVHRCSSLFGIHFTGESLEFDSMSAVQKL